MIVTALVAVYLAIGWCVARAVVVTQDTDFGRDYEGSGARAGFNVIAWPIALVAGLLLPAIGYLVTGKWKP